MNASSSYFVLCQFSTGRAWIERDDARTDWSSTIEDLANGEIEGMIEVRRAEDWADVTMEAAKACVQEWALAEEPLGYQAYTFVENHLGTRAARSFLRAS